MWSVWQTCRTGRRVAGFLGGLLILLLVTAPAAAALDFTVLQEAVSNGGSGTSAAVAATSSGKVYVAWKEGKDIFFKRYVPAGGSCAGPGRLELDRAANLSNIPLNLFGSPTVLAEHPAIAANDQDGVFVVWSELVQSGPTIGSRSIRLWRSMDRGETTASIQSLGFSGASPRFPAVAADNNRGVFVAAEGSVGVKTSVVVAQSTDDGANFTSGNLSADRAESRRPSIASDGSRVHVAWRGAGVWYKGFAPGSEINNAAGNAVGDVPGAQLTGAAVNRPPKIAVHGSQVTGAWFEGTTVKARTAANGNFDLSVRADTVYDPAPSTPTLSNLSLSPGVAGRFFAWQELAGSTSSIRYSLESGSPETLPSGIYPEGIPATPTAGPSVGQDGTTGRIVATWRENGSTSTEIKLAHTGGSGGGGMAVRVWADPRVLNYRTVRSTGQQPNFTVFIEPTDPKVSASAIDPRSVKLKIEGKNVEHSPLPGSPSALGDHDGNGTIDLMVKFNRSIFDGAGTATAAQSTGNYPVSYTVTGNTTTGGCFASKDGVQVMR